MSPLEGRKPGVQPGRYGVQTRLARSYGLVVLVTGFALVLLLTLALAASLAAHPPLGSTLPGVVFVQGLEVVGEEGAPVPGLTIYSTHLYTPVQLDQSWTRQVVRRLALYGATALAGIILTALALSYVLARRVSRPLTEMAHLAGELSAANLGRRMAPPNTNDELGQLAGAFNGMLDRLQAAFDDVEQLTSHASHELRTSLAVIKAHLELGLSDEAGLRQEAKAALAAADRLTGWAGDVLSVSSRTVREAPSAVDLALLAAEVVDEYSRPGRTLTLDIPPDGVPAARGNESWLRRALANLLDNAFKYGPPNGPVAVKVERRFDAVIASVADRGPGITEADQNRVWDRYYRGRSARGGPVGGRGLGLALVRQAAEAAGGTTWLCGRVGAGSVFFISIPILEPAGPAPAAEAAGPAGL